MLGFVLQRIACIVMLIATVSLWVPGERMASRMVMSAQATASADLCGSDELSTGGDDDPSSPCDSDGPASDEEENSGVELAYPVEPPRSLPPSSFRFAFVIGKSAEIRAYIEPSSPPPRA